MPHTYPNQQESLLAKVKGKTGKISDKTHEEHLKLYTGYVNKSNGILAEIEKLGVPDPANPAIANQIYSTVRALLRILEDKGHVRHREDGPRYIYVPVIAPAEASRSALRHVLDTFFEGSAAGAMAALLGDDGAAITEDELKRMESLIAKARKGGK